MDLKYLIRHSENKENSPSIFLLHGYGSNKEDLFSLEGYLPINHTIISLEAPIGEEQDLNLADLIEDQNAESPQNSASKNLLKSVFFVITFSEGDSG